MAPCEMMGRRKTVEAVPPQVLRDRLSGAVQALVVPTVMAALHHDPHIGTRVTYHRDLVCIRSEHNADRHRSQPPTRQRPRNADAEHR